MFVGDGPVNPLPPSAPTPLHPHIYFSAKLDTPPTLFCGRKNVLGQRSTSPEVSDFGVALSLRFCSAIQRKTEPCVYF